MSFLHKSTAHLRSINELSFDDQYYGKSLSNMTFNNIAGYNIINSLKNFFKTYKVLLENFEYQYKFNEELIKTVLQSDL